MNMTLSFTNAFDVALPPEQTWKLLQQLDLIAPCLPGGTLTEWDGGDHFAGEVKTKLGPMRMTFGGKGRITLRDTDAHRIQISGEGVEGKGRGRAQAEFGFVLAENDDGTTRVTSNAEVTLIGAVAQYGRGAGMIQALADELTRQFAANLACLIETGEAGEASLSITKLAGRTIATRFRRSEET